jgi:hypothetical protein
MSTYDLNIYKSLLDDKISKIFYINAKTSDNIDVQIYISFYNLIIYPNPITFGMNITFSYKKYGGFINYTCDNINYDNIVKNNYSLILRCDNISGGVFENYNLNNAYLVIDNNNNISYKYAIDNLINSNFYFQINNNLNTFNGNLFQTNLGDTTEYINNVVNSKIINIQGNFVYDLLININYSLLNITNSPVFEYKLLNDTNNKKFYNIVITFIGTDINDINNNTINLLIDEIVNTLFYNLKLVFYPLISSNSNNTTLQNEKKLLNTSINVPTVQNQLTTSFISKEALNICIGSNITQNINITNSNLIKESGIPTFIIYNVNIQSGGILNLINKSTYSDSEIIVSITNGLGNYGTINCPFNLVLTNANINPNDTCPNFNIEYYYLNNGCINLGSNNIEYIGITLDGNGHVCAGNSPDRPCPCK